MNDLCLPAWHRTTVIKTAPPSQPPNRDGKTQNQQAPCKFHYDSAPMREVGSLVGFENPLRGSDLCHPFDARPCFKIPGLDLLEGIFFFF